MLASLKSLTASFLWAFSIAATCHVAAQYQVQQEIHPEQEPSIVSPAGLRYLDVLDPEQSALYGYAPARAVETILDDLANLILPPYPPEDADTKTKIQYGRQKYIFHFTHANLVTELLRAGYADQDLNDLLLQQVESTSYVYQVYINFLVPSTGRQLRQIAKRHPGTPAADLANYNLLYLNLLQPAFIIHPREMDRIAAVEKTLPHGESEAGQLIFWTMRKWTEEEREPWYDWILKNLPQNSYGVRKVLLERKKIGAPAHVEGTGLDGEQIDTREWEGNGKYTVVYFWGMWCGPCKASTPDLRRINELYELQIVGIYCGTDPEYGSQYMHEQGLDIPLVVNDTIKVAADISRHPVALQYAVTSFPTYLLIDDNGILLGRFGRPADIEKAILERQ